MKIVIAGGSGHVGTILARDFHADGHEVVVLSRNPRPAPWWSVQWDGKALGPWAAQLDGADVGINLAGRSVNCRYNAKNRREIVESRVASTRAIGEAIGNCARPPRVWLQMSTATIYSHRYDAPNDERLGTIGGSEPDVPETWRFSIDVARAWEAALDAAVTPKTRKVKMRTAIVMSTVPGGAFTIYRRLVRLGLGGKHGDGRQFVSWIHERDFIRAVRWLIMHDDMYGAINLASPHPLPNEHFLRELRSSCGVALGLPAPKGLLEVAAFVHRTETELLLKSRRVVPSALLDAGFTFEFPEWPEAARDLCTRAKGAGAWSLVW